MSSTKAILCVDDEDVILNSLGLQLRDHYGSQYCYETANSGEEAFLVINELVKEGVTTILVISDWLMPGMKGDEFIIEVNRKFPDTVKIMLTGQADPKFIKNAEDNGDMFSCIRKPWDKKYLLSVIDKALGL